MSESPSKLHTASVLIQTLSAVFSRVVSSKFRGSKAHPVYFKDIAFAGVRVALANGTLAEESALPSTGENYLAFAKQLKFEPQTVDIGQNAKVHWLGNKNASKVIAYLHGGGYVLAGNAGHFTWLNELMNTFNDAGHDISVCVLEYTLAPKGCYPTQLDQAAAFIQYLLETGKRDPSTIIVGGDSAGGNLTTGLLAHLLHPHPSIPAIPLSKPLAAAFLLSPWISFDTTYNSYKKNAESDAFGATPLQRWSAAFLGPSGRSDNYSEPIIASPAWWEGMEKVVSEVLVWGGGGEVLIDSIRIFAAKFRERYEANGGKFVYVETPRAAHEEMVIDKLFGYKTKGKYQSEVEDWVKARL